MNPKTKKRQDGKLVQAKLSFGNPTSGTKIPKEVTTKKTPGSNDGDTIQSSLSPQPFDVSLNEFTKTPDTENDSYLKGNVTTVESDTLEQVPSSVDTVSPEIKKPMTPSTKRNGGGVIAASGKKEDDKKEISSTISNSDAENVMLTSPKVKTTKDIPNDTDDDEDDSISDANVNDDHSERTYLPSVGRYEIGTTVCKEFKGCGWFNGRVAGYSADDQYYTIQYEDGDKEDMDHEEIQNYIGNKLTSPKSTGTKRRVASPSTKGIKSLKKAKTELAHQPKTLSIPNNSNLRSLPSRRSKEKTKTIIYKDDSTSCSEEEEAEFNDTSISSTDKDEEECFDDESLEGPQKKKMVAVKRRSKQATSLRNISVVEVSESPSDNDDDEEDEEEVEHSKLKRKIKPQAQTKSIKPIGKSRQTSLTGGIVSSTNIKKPSTLKTIQKKQSNNVQGGIVVAGSYDKKPYSAGIDLPIIIEPQDMFDDMINKQLTENGSDLSILLPIIRLQHRKIRIATMCSGTESPILALDMLQKSINDFILDHKKKYQEECNVDVDRLTINDDGFHALQLEHVFSCEIEPFKQAYIERNFNPPILFRDIRELGYDQAYTAYGALHDVPNKPGDVDILIAGTSCVDYSNLNTKKKELEEHGESGQTFVGMLKWIEKAQPPIVIIENVYGAPWEKKVQMFNDMGYSATFLRLDTKDYYIPHTRQRGYLFAIRKKLVNDKVKGKKNTVETDARPKKWQDLVNKLKRPASATLDEFMLANDDPRVLRGRARLTAESSDDKDGSGGGSRAGRVDWTKCETRHQDSRSKEMLGDKRPLTEWSDSGNTTMPNFAWNEWTNAQVHRIHDLMDINTLRLAQVGMDCTYKTMVWNLSQNVDRDTMGKLGLCQCLTPTGVPYVTNRGGPLVGEELLLLQGIPADDLLLTKESEDNLKDLAGNAMSTTVVGACTIAALLIGLNDGILSSQSNSSSGNEEGRSIGKSDLVPRALVPVSKVSISRSMGQYQDSVVTLGPIRSLINASEYKTLLLAGHSSTRKSISEGAEEVLSVDSLVECKDCGKTEHIVNAFPPRKFEEHNFEAFRMSGDRVQPSVFKQSLLELLPMRLQLQGIDVNDIKKPSHGKDEGIWDEWMECVRNTVTVNNGTPAEFQFTRIVRTHIWTVIYLSHQGGRLEARLTKSGITWYLFTKRHAKEGKLSSFLDNPVARLSVDPKDKQSLSLLDGVWEICLPLSLEAVLSIEGYGRILPSWCNLLGLKGEYETEYQYETLGISVDSMSPGLTQEFKSEIEGNYNVLSKCGGACGSLRKKETESGENIFFFLSSGRKTIPKDDTYIFAKTCHRTSNGEHREILLEIDKQEEYRPIHRGEKPLEATNSGYEAKKVHIRAYVPGFWQKLQKSGIVSHNESDLGQMTFSYPCASLDVPSDIGAWQTAPELASCSVVVRDEEHLLSLCNKAGGCLELNLQKARKVFDKIAFATSRLNIPDFFLDGKWLTLKQNNASKETDVDVCSICAPTKPNVQWTHISKGNRTLFVPMEDGKEAAVYERRLKTRPTPWIVRLQTLSGDCEKHSTMQEEFQSLTVQISCNANSLLQRALGLLPSESLPRLSLIELCNEQRDVTSRSSFFEWRIVPHVEKVLPSFSKLTFTSNKFDDQAAQPPSFQRYPLRKEQLRSLKWMLEQESTVEPFFEEEVTESVLPCLNWRSEARIRRPVLLRGGIIADEVGYGKTAITLGLIDSAEKINGPCPGIPFAYKDGYIKSNATLVIVPKHLMGQWPQEVKKFVGSKRKVIVLQDMSNLNKLTIEDLQRADIVIVSFAVLSNEKYFSRLARLAGVNPRSMPSGNNGGRHFNAVYKECLSSLNSRVSQIMSDTSTAYSKITTDADACTQKQKSADSNDLRLDGKKSYYNKDTTNATNLAASTFKLEASERDPWGLSTPRVKNTYSKMQCPPLEMFYWNRVVVDEFTYLSKKERERVWEVILKIKSSFRWCLSGTPKHGDFNDIQILSSLLGVHLGIDEVMPGVKISKRLLADKETTGLESLAHYLESRSVQWHERRHQLAQAFLNRFVRQNIAEIEEIPFEEHEIVVELPPAERAIYLELETHLKSLEMNSKNAQKSKKKSTGDRESRMQKVLQESASAEEALLKCCSHFNMSQSSVTALETLQDIIEKREEQKKLLVQELQSSLRSAFLLRHKILQYQPDWVLVKETGQGEVKDGLGEYLFLVDSKKGIPHGGDDEIHTNLELIVAKAKKVFEEDPSRPDHIYEDNDSESDDESMRDKKRKKSSNTKSVSTKKLKEISSEILFDMKQALRNHMHGVRALVKEFCGRSRSLRYIQCIRNFQQQASSTGFICRSCTTSNCSGTPTNVEKVIDQMGVLSSCGHSGCVACLTNCANEGRCIDPECNARVSSAHIVHANNLSLNRDDNSGGRFGAKLTQVVQRVKEIIQDDDGTVGHRGDRLIVFCQFDDLKEKVKEALTQYGIKALEVKGTVMQQINTISIFQKEKIEKNDPRVLLLKMDDEQSAGLNLTNLNHAVFIHPLLANTKAEYTAYETQAIGRIRRYGQTKTVHVWRFLAKDTIDTELYYERTGKQV